MEQYLSLDGIVWLVLVGTILGGGMGTMAWYYRRPLRNSVLFATPVDDLSVPLKETARRQFDQGCEQFRLGRFPRALEHFIAAAEQQPDCAEALHNCALAHANLGNDNYALRGFLKAEALYDRQGSKERIDAIKAELEQLKQRRVAMAAQANG
ncbi:hypothetical protein C7271_10140 [filamentous cyanobacterium CCP5]|nr:hypothetical protein C7271_10140 [filamentous cyanobacterium CCP5]